MGSGVMKDVDFVEELRMRRWARENYVPHGLRQTNWHPVIHDEMQRKDSESGEGQRLNPSLR